MQYVVIYNFVEPRQMVFGRRSAVLQLHLFKDFAELKAVRGRFKNLRTSCCSKIYEGRWESY